MIEFEKKEQSPMEIWAEKEVALACEKERSLSENGDEEYGVKCYESALRAFRSLLRDGHSGFSITLTQSILNRLIEGKPLTIITDENADWQDISAYSASDNIRHFQSSRTSSLFKDIYPDGTVKYSDINRFVCTSDDELGRYRSGFINRLLDSIFPITLPYDVKTFYVSCDSCLTDSKNGDFDTQAIFYATDEAGRRIDINRYFKEGPDDWIEIGRLEWTRRKAKDKRRAS